jgi:single-strand selective monofunctional uracil DNA glycosylase
MQRIRQVYLMMPYAVPSPGRQYIHKHARTAKRVLYLGMNPGPFGMAQTGVWC